MKTDKIMAPSLLSSLGTTAYIAAVAWFLSNGNRWFGKGEDDWRAPLAMLLLFVFSATVVGLLVLGRPIALYLDGAKKAAWQSLFYVVGLLFVITFIVFLTIFVWPR